MKCTCGVENLSDAKFCTGCGKKMEVAMSSVVTASAAAVQSAPAIPASAQAPPGFPRPTVPQRRATKVGVLPKVLIIVALIAAGAAYWWFNRPEPDYVAEESGLIPFMGDGNKWGFMDKTGGVQIQPAYNWAGNFAEGLAPVLQQGKFGFVDTHGQLVIEPQFDYFHQFVHGLAAVKLCCGQGYNNNDQWGFISKDGKYVINPQFQDVGDFTGSVAPVKVDGSWGLVDTKGNLVVKPTFNYVMNFSEGLAAASEGGRWGFIGTDGKFVIKPQFNSAGLFREQLARVTVGRKIGFINRSGKMIINPQFEYATDFRHGFAVVSTGGKQGTIDRNGTFLLNPGQLSLILEPGDDLIAAKNENGWGYVDHRGAWVVAPTKAVEVAGAMHNGVAIVQVSGEQCYIDKNGTVIRGAYKGQSLANVAKVQEAETAAVSALRVIVQAQVTYSTTYPESGYASQLGKLGPPPPGAQPSNSAAALISAGLAQGDDAGYHFTLLAPAEVGITSHYTITATPASGAGGRAFCTNQLGVIRVVAAGETCNPDNSPQFTR
jgi:hypothetical protein